jgi:hypothetical protein
LARQCTATRNENTATRAERRDEHDAKAQRGDADERRPAPVLLVEDDDCSMFNKYKRTMLMLHFVNSNVDEMTAPEMKTKWKELLKGDDVVSKSTFVKYKSFNIRKVCAAPLNAQLCARF